MAVFFIADTHFNHPNVIGFCARPFADGEEMNETMVANWNAVVRPGDEVWHLGDFALGSGADAAKIFRRLSGIKHLVIGNHDRRSLDVGWASPPAFLREISVDGRRLCLCHYGMRVWPGQRRGALHLYGHSHGRLPGTSTSLDVGVDCWEFRPVTLSDIIARMGSLPDVDPEA